MWDQSNIKLTGGPHGIPRNVVTKIQRDRLMRAMARTVAEFGYQDTTVRRLLGRAGLSRRTYYELFEDKEECFLAAYDEAVDHVLGLMVEAYEQGSEPEERIERGLRAFLQFCADEPDVARMCIVEVLAAGPQAITRRARTIEEFTELFEENARALLGRDAPGPLIAETIVGGIYETVYRRIARGETTDLPRLLPDLVESALLPYVGERSAAAQGRALREAAEGADRNSAPSQGF